MTAKNVYKMRMHPHDTETEPITLLIAIAHKILIMRVTSALLKKNSDEIILEQYLISFR